MSRPNPLVAPFMSRCCSVLAFCSALTTVSPLIRADTPPQFAFSFGPGQIPGGISPLATATDGSGKIYISSLWNVVQVDANGTFLNRWGTQGAGPGQFSYAGPMGIDGSGHLFVIDDYNNRVEEFSTNGDFITAWGSYGTQPGQFDQPGGLAVSRSGRIYVADMLNFRVQVFSSPGVFLEQFGSNGTNAGQFSFPGALAMDSSNNVYVTDSPGGSFDNYRVQKFDANGNFLLAWAAYGTNAGGSIQVGGLATDLQNNVYVADGSNNRVQKFDSAGRFLCEWGNFGTGPGQFNTPSGIALDPTGNYVYVADYYNARINVFAYTPQAPILYQAPTNQIVPAGSILTLNAGVFGAQPLGYQWQFNGADILGATGSFLSISNVSLAASGSYTVSATNALGRAFSPGATISVLPVVVTTLPVSGITATSAVLNGSFRVGNQPTTSWFEWGTNTSYGNFAGFTNLDLNSSRAVSLKLSGLNGEVVYHYRAAASNDWGAVYGQDVSFQVGLEPNVVTLPVTATDSGEVVFNARVNPEARNTRAFFRWGKYEQYDFTPTNSLPGIVGPLTLQSQVTGLQPGALYQVQAVATNELGTVYGAIVRFIAPPWVLLPTPTGINWASLALSADGSNLVAAGSGAQIYRSIDSGMTWGSNNVPKLFWQGVSLSADGTRLAAVEGGASALGSAYYSTNSGKSWSRSNEPNHNWYALASSADGARLAAVDILGPRVLTSTNAGVRWQTNSPAVAANWDAIACSADGQRLLVAAGGALRTTYGPVYTSTNAGLSWTSNDLPLASWHAVASSADGQILLAAVGGQQSGPMYLSTNGGASWAITGAPVTNWQSVAVSADGSKLAALARVSVTPVFVSTNLGLSWQRATLPEALWSSLALSADGARLVAAGDQNIVTLQTAPTPRLETGLAQGELSLSWVIPSGPFVLEHSPDLFRPGWTKVSSAPTVSFTNLRYQVTVPAAGAGGFYRLRGAD